MGLNFFNDFRSTTTHAENPLGFEKDEPTREMYISY